jgi:hypothetical protein
MKKSFFAMFFLVLIIGSFLGGAWYSQHATDKKHGAERRILHYVDPMNPANTSDKPGIAPCGMPMEPVYADKNFAEGPDSLDSPLMSPGTVRISPQKQQIIGVQIGAVENVSETHVIRTLGRIVPDENRVYRLITAIDGWMWNLQGSTTGSLVNKDQLMAQVIVYSYDFFSWQQRYLTELGNAGRRQQPGSPYSGAWPPQEPRHLTERDNTVRGRQPGLPYSGAWLLLNKTQPGEPLSAPSQARATHRKGIPPTAMQYGESSPETPTPELPRSKPQFPDVLQIPPTAPPQNVTIQPKEAPLASSPYGGAPPITPRPVEPRPETQHSPGYYQMERPLPADNQPLSKLSIAEYAASKAKLELLNLGVSNTQIEELERSGKYGTFIELRSPVTGLVLSRNISSQQRVDRGTECFRVADLSRVWVVADVFNTETHHIRPGMIAKISLPGQSRRYDARVSDILPVFDPTTRTLKVRLEMDNPKNTLRPEMFVDVEFLTALPPALTVPLSAVLDSGRRQTVFTALGHGYFEPRTVITGWRFGDRVEIVEGLKPGDQIVISGNFLIDSESRMKQAAAGLSGTPGNDPPDKTPQRFKNKFHESPEEKSAPGPAGSKHD